MIPAEANGIAKSQRHGASLLKAVLFGGVVGTLLAFGGNTYYLVFAGNFHNVLPNKVYRSGQLTPDELEKVVRKYNIRTVINLRGCCESAPWYLKETRATHRLNISQEDFALSASRLPSTYEVRRLVEVLNRGEGPFLIHCRRGADRTGLASAIALLLLSDISVAEAREQLAFRYGHVAMGKPGLIHRFFDLYEEWLEQQGRDHSPRAFGYFAQNAYCPCEGRAFLELTQPLDWVPADRPFSLTIRAWNMSIRPWHFRSGTNVGIHAGCMLLDADYRWLVTERAGLFDAAVKPGESIELTFVLPALSPGRYHLTVDMTEEQHCWFFQLGSESLELEFEVGVQKTSAGSRPASAELVSLAD